jgi:hypothetical protein
MMSTRPSSFRRLQRLSADPKHRVDQVRRVPTPVGMRSSREPVELRRRVDVGVASGHVPPKALTRHDVRQAVAVHVCKVERVWLMNENATSCIGRVVRGQEMLDERPRAGVHPLLEPCDTVVVSGEARNDVSVTITIDVVDEHLCATGPK